MRHDGSRFARSKRGNKAEQTGEGSTLPRSPMAANSVKHPITSAVRVASIHRKPAARLPLWRAGACWPINPVSVLGLADLRLTRCTATTCLSRSSRAQSREALAESWSKRRAARPLASRPLGKLAASRDEGS
jgi:hypothetical protein